MSTRIHITKQNDNGSFEGHFLRLGGRDYLTGLFKEIQETFNGDDFGFSPKTETEIFDTLEDYVEFLETGDGQCLEYILLWKRGKWHSISLNTLRWKDGLSEKQS